MLVNIIVAIFKNISLKFLKSYLNKSWCYVPLVVVVVFVLVVNPSFCLTSECE